MHHRGCNIRTLLCVGFRGVTAFPDRRPISGFHLFLWLSSMGG